MVMKQSAMRRNLRQSIVKSFGRYIAISAIIALGAGLFVGLLMTKRDMVETGQIFMDQQNMFDLRMISNYGWTEEYVEEFASLPGVEDAEGVFYTDLIAKTGEDAEDAVYRFYTLPEHMNMVALRGGRMPETDNECLADGYFCDESILGKHVLISQTNDEDSLDIVNYKEFTIVGYVSTPLYMDMNRGTTSVGSGSLENYYYVPAGAFDTDYYTEINLRLQGAHRIYSNEYNDFLDDAVDAMENEANQLSQRRFQEIKQEVEDEYNEGYQEYMDGLSEFQEGKAEAEQEMADAEAELLDAEKKVEDGYNQLVKAQNDIKNGYAQIQEGWAELESNRQMLTQQLEQMNSAIPLAQEDIAKAEQIIGMSGEALQGAIASTQGNVSTQQANVQAAQQQIDAANSVLSNPEASETDRAAAGASLAEGSIKLAAAQTELQKAQLDLQALNKLNEIYVPVANALNLLISYRNQAQAGLATIESTANQLQQKWTELENAEYQVNIKWGEWGKGRDELEEGWVEFEEAKAEALKEIADAEAELKDAKRELDDARAKIDDMEDGDLIILDRNSNVGYNNLESSSDIVSGVSRIFPVFFLLVASLVCITTMTRMIDEERTQIGTLKALGYTNGEIMSKYLIYSGSGAVLGCTLGIIVGCTIFPMIIWEAYKIMLYIQPNLVLTVNWPLAIAVVLVYTGVMLLVTWYTCKKTLEEEPAELIRPKAPDAGKQIILEYFPLWKKLSFLNKVTIRNIFRYRQRLAMMMIGIGGCIALLVTGFGLRDTIVNIADYQFQDVTHYDMSVYFRDDLTRTEMNKFEKIVKNKADEYMFYHQSSVELDFNNRVKEIYMISGDSALKEFIDLHKGVNQLYLPGKNEVVLSVGVAENMGIDVGDTVIMRNADMQEMELEVSAIYDNYVYNYSIVDPDTIEQQWGSPPELQMAFVKVEEGQSIHNLGADINDLDFVMNVAVSEDMAEMVGSMMDALDLVVIVIVFCAGLLAVIVLYNLTNININERIREIATIKVLGFNASETAAYVFKENLSLTVIGSLVGLLMGKLLLLFVIDQIKIDMVWFQAMTTPASYGLSLALTLLSAIVVDFIFYFKLEKINMAEALKSVE